MRITTLAYAKVVLHAAKHASQAVLGVLLAKQGSDEVSEVAALAHGSVTAPVLEMAMLQLEKLAEARNLRIVGVYAGNERFEDTAVPHTAVTLATQIERNGDDVKPLVVLVDNVRMDHADEDEPAVLFCSDKRGAWKAGEGSGNVEAGAVAQTRDMLEKEAYYGVFDFVEHLDDVKRDWLNSDL